MIADHNNKLIIVISSPSGAGKTSVCHKLIEKDQSIGLSISDTTRPPRDNEKNGLDYNFIDEIEFEKKINNNLYIEYAYVFENYYGSPRKNISDHFDNGRDILFDIDWQGAAKLRSSSFSNILSIFIIPPSKKTIYERLKMRAKKSGDDELAIEKRMKQFETEMTHKDDYDYTIVNNELNTCVKEIQKIIKKHRDIIK